MKSWVGAVLVAGFVLVAGLTGCQNDLSDEDIDKIVDRMAQNNVLSDEDIDKIVDRMAQNNVLGNEDIDRMAQSMVDTLMAHPRYLEYLEDDAWVEAMVDAQMAHPEYQTTPEEDCSTIILMATVMAGSTDEAVPYTLPPDSEADRLCAWYLRQ